MRRFAIIASTAPSSGTFTLNDLPSAGRMDVICRNIGSSLLLSHGIRRDAEVIVHLMGGPGKPRRIRFRTSGIVGLRADERSIAGMIRGVIGEPLPPLGIWKEYSSGISHSGGGLGTTLDEWHSAGVSVFQLDKDGSTLDSIHKIPLDSGFIVGDHTPLEAPVGAQKITLISTGDQWLLGSASISIVHHWLDSHSGNPSTSG